MKLLAIAIAQHATITTFFASAWIALNSREEKSTKYTGIRNFFKERVQLGDAAFRQAFRMRIEVRNNTLTAFHRFFSLFVFRIFHPSIKHGVLFI